MHAIGFIRRGEYVRESLHTTSWQEASRLVRDAEIRGYWRQENGIASNGPRTLGAAIEAFLVDAAHANGRNLRDVTVARYRSELGKLLEFAGDVTVASIEPDTIRRFKETWKVGPSAASGTLCRVKAAFKFFLEQGWIEKNPAAVVRIAKAKGAAKKKLPFSADEMERIIAAATELFGAESDCLTLIHVLRHSGLRISDAAFLRKYQVLGNLIRITATQKTRAAVDIPIPGWLAERLAQVTVKQDGGYLFASGSLRLSTVTDLWRRKVKQVFRKAGVKGTVHAFRHTFATSLIAKGVPIDLVSRLLTHSSINITQKVYFSWLKESQDRLQGEMQRIWDLDKAA